MEKEVKPYYEDDYQSLDERTIHRINQILASRAIYATQLELF